MRRVLIRTAKSNQSPPMASKANFIFLSAAAVTLGGCRGPEVDYKITLLSPPVSLRLGEGAVFEHAVHNAGKTKSPNRGYSVLMTVYDASSSEVAEEWLETAGSSLAPGEASTYSMSSGYWHWKPIAPGKYTVRLEVIPNPGTVDPVPSNNAQTISVTVTK